MTKEETPPQQHTGDISSKGDPANLLQKLVRSEKTRYERKGFGFFVACLIVASSILGYPVLCQTYWPVVLEWVHENDLGYFWMHFIISLSLHNGIYWSGNAFFWFLYHNEFAFIERYKINDLPWPWYSDLEEWRTLCWKSCLCLFMNGFVLIPSLLLSEKYLGIDQEFSMTMEDLPNSKELVLSLIFFMAVEDFLFYNVHRLLHWRMIYPYIHKMHHTHKVTVSIGAEYAHPVEHIVNAMCVMAGPKLLGFNCHTVTVFAWYIVRFIETMDAHSGYEFSWSPFRLLPLSGSADYHDFHHEVNVGNYASFFCIWDTVFGTNKVYLEAKQQVEEQASGAKTSKTKTE